MFENLVDINFLSFMLVFIEGVISFFSPCVLPLIPLYMGYLSGNAKRIDNEGNITYDKKKVLINTSFFIIGISCAFFILGMSFSAIGKFLLNEKKVFSIIAGVIILILGVFQLGVIKLKFLSKEYKINKKINKMNPLIALVLGFTFSFAWTPCVGPMLGSVLILASNTSSILLGNLLVLVYALGFVIPFVIIGLVASKVLNFLKKKQKLLSWVIKIGGVILIIIGIITIVSSTELPQLISNQFLDNKGKFEQNAHEKKENINDKKDTNSSNTNSSLNKKNESSGTNSLNNAKKTKVYDFILEDQYGNQVKLSDYIGKVVFLNFWGTWCGPCKMEMPHIQEIYEKYNTKDSDVVILAVANPKSDKNKFTQETDKEGIKKFLKSNNYTYPVVFDMTGEVFEKYNIYSFPTTYMIDKEGNIFGYVEGSLSKSMMQKMIDQTLAGK